MRVLVTGGTGFIGHNLAAALLIRGDDVTALVRSPSKAARLVESGVRTVRGDLENVEALAAACAGSQVIYHVAGAIKARNEAGYLRANERGTRLLVRAAEAAGSPRFVLVSSMAAAGPTEPGRPLRGDEATRPVTAYGRSKLAAEAAVRGSRLPWTIVRPPVVYGPHDRSLLPAFRLARRGIGVVFGSGNQELSAIYAPDLVEALVAVASREATVGGVYYACHPELFRSRDFVRAAGSAVGREPRIIALPPAITRSLLRVTGTAAALAGRATVLNPDKANEFLAAAWTGNPDRLTRDTGWSASHDLSRGLPRTASWYREAGWL